MFFSNSDYLSSPKDWPRHTRPLKTLNVKDVPSYHAFMNIAELGITSEIGEESHSWLMPGVTKEVRYSLENGLVHQTIATFSEYLGYCHCIRYTKCHLMGVVSLCWYGCYQSWHIKASALFLSWRSLGPAKSN